MKTNKKQIAKITVFITSIFIIFISVSYASLTVVLQGTKQQAIQAGILSLELDESENTISLTDAFPMYDEVGMIQDAFTFRLINNGTTSANYKLKLIEIGTGSLSKEDVKYGLTKNGETLIDLLSSIPSSGVIDSGVIGKSPETIEYSLRLWIKDSVTDNEAIAGKSLSYKIGVEISQEIEEIVLPPFVTQLENLVKESTYAGGVKVHPNFNLISSSTNGRGIYKFQEDGKDIYYWRGNVAATDDSDNNVIFAGYCWQMVRTTKTGGMMLF